MPNAPQSRYRFETQDDEISYLGDKVIYWVNQSNWSRARHFGERLAELVSEPDPVAVLRETKKNIFKSYTAVSGLFDWVLVCESRRDFERAAQFEDVSLLIRERYLREFYTDLDHGDDDFREDVEDLLDGYQVQAIRIMLYMDDNERARLAMKNAVELANRYGVPLDESQKDLAAELEIDL